eukprot:3206330-Amphidinium_carterae.1
MLNGHLARRLGQRGQSLDLIVVNQRKNYAYPTWAHQFTSINQNTSSLLFLLEEHYKSDDAISGSASCRQVYTASTLHPIVEAL